MRLFAVFFHSHKTVLVISVGDEGIVALQIGDKHNVVSRTFFPTEDLSLEILAVLVQEFPIYVLLNHPEQEYVLHTTNSADQYYSRSLLTARLNKASCDIKGYRLLEAGSTYRTYLIISAQLSTLTRKLTNILEQLSCNFRGFILLPMELVKITHKLAIILNENHNVWHISAVYNKICGVRFITLKNQQMVSTSLLSCDGETHPSIIAGNIYQVIQESIDSLQKLGFDKNKQQIQLYVALPEEIKTSFLLIKISPEIRLHTFTPFELAKALGLAWSTQLSDKFCDTVLSCAIFSDKSYDTFSTEQTTRTFYISLLRLYSKPVFSALLVLLITGNLLLLNSSNTQKNERETLIVRKTLLQAELNKIKQSSHTKNNDKIYDIMQIYRFLSTINKSPLDFIADVNAKTFGHNKLQDLTWTTDDKTNKVAIKMKFTLSSSSSQFVEYEKLREIMQRQFHYYQVLPLNTEDTDEYINIELRSQ